MKWDAHSQVVEDVAWN